MKYQPKVTNIETINGKNVVKGKLVLQEPYTEPITSGVDWCNDIVKPMIVSETEEIEVGDKYLNLEVDGNKKNPFYGKIYHESTLQLKDSKVSEDYKNKWVKKILALPEQFSDPILQYIADGNLTDGDEVYLKCEGVTQSTTWEYDDPEYYRIHLNEQNHITIYPIAPSLAKAADDYAIIHHEHDVSSTYQYQYEAFKAGAIWAKNNNNK